MARRRAAVLATIVALGVFASPVPVHAAGAHRALVIVETGDSRYERVVTFDGDSITGVQALQLAGADPVLYTYSGQGGAVCRLFGVGRDAGPGCLGGADGDNRYWAYFRAPAGTSTFVYSRAGAGSTQVHDGDVEGWRFATGQAPAWAALPPVTPPPTATPPPSAPNPATPSPKSQPGGVVSPSPSPSAEDLLKIAAAIQAASTTSRPADASANAESQVESARTSRGARRLASGALASTDGGSDGGSASLVAFGAVLVALAAGAVLVRRSRRRPIP